MPYSGREVYRAKREHRLRAEIKERNLRHSFDGMGSDLHSGSSTFSGDSGTYDHGRNDCCVAGCGALAAGLGAELALLVD